MLIKTYDISYTVNKEMVTIENFKATESNIVLNINSEDVYKFSLLKVSSKINKENKYVDVESINKEYYCIYLRENICTRDNSCNCFVICKKDACRLGLH